MLVVSSGGAGVEKAMAVLRGGGSALDAVEAGIREVESDPDDHSVGYGGYPNILGKVELDACIMDGRTRRAGAVAALTWCAHPISVARRVMEELPHLLLVGDGADRFAREAGFPREETLSPAMRRAWEERMATLAAEGGTDLRRLVRVSADPRTPRDTVDFIVIDRNGSLASGVSTSGWSWKYPGRVGDSPVIGAGNYADQRYGAAACTGRGEMAIRAATARSVVLYMKAGMGVEEACAEAMRDMADLEDAWFGWVDIVAVDRGGKAHGVTWEKGHTMHRMEDGMDAPIAVPKALQPLRRAAR
jgi:L-asparaginase / beta-aspartyl-peptidase